MWSFSSSFKEGEKIIQLTIDCILEHSSNRDTHTHKLHGETYNSFFIHQMVRIIRGICQRSININD